MQYAKTNVQDVQRFSCRFLTKIADVQYGKTYVQNVQLGMIHEGKEQGVNR